MKDRDARFRFYYVHQDGWVSDDIDEVWGKCVGIVEARTIEQAEQQARDRGLMG